MKRNLTPARRVSALLLGAAALTSLPVLAQDAPTQQAAPPPAAEPPSAVPDVAPPPVVQAAPAPQAQTPAVTMAPQAPIVQPVPEAPVAQAPAPVARAVRTTAQTRTTRTVARATAPAPEPAPAPRAVTSPAPRSATSPSAGVVAPEGPAVSNATTSDTLVTPPASEPAAAAPAPAVANDGRASLSTLLAWGFGIAIALVALGLLWVAVRRRNSSSEIYVDQTPRSVREPVMVEPEIPATMPLAAAPIAAAAPPTEQNERVFASEAQEAHPVNGTIQHELHPAESATTHDADAEDLSGIADGGAPVADRPWLEFGIRPLRAGTSHKDAMVEVELIVGNAGDTEAEDVRISTFMLSSGSADEMDHILTEHLSDASAEPVNIAPGEGTCVDAILSVSRTELNGDTSFEPIVVAEARYKLPDGSEGRTSAAFKLGVTDDKGDRFDPIALDRAEIYHSVAAQLHGTPEHV